MSKSPAVAVRGLSTVRLAPVDRALQYLGRQSPVNMARLRGPVVDISLALEPQFVAVLGLPQDGTLDLADALVGRVRPTQGSVLVHGVSPSANAGIRRRIGLLSDRIGDLPARKVQDVLLVAERLSGSPLRAQEVGRRFGLEALLARRVCSLSLEEHRAVELWIALSLHDPALLVLIEPFSQIACFERQNLSSYLTELAQHAVVVAITSSSEDAGTAPGGTLVLERGRLIRGTGPLGEGLGQAAPSWFSIWVGRGAREVAKALLDQPDVRSVSLEPSVGASLLRVGVGSEVVGAQGIASAVAAVDCELLGLSGLAPQRVAVGLTSEFIQLQSHIQAVDRIRQAQEQYVRVLHEQRLAEIAQNDAMQGQFGAALPHPSAAPHGTAYAGHPPDHPALSHGNWSHTGDWPHTAGGQWVQPAPQHSDPSQGPAPEPVTLAAVAADDDVPPAGDPSTTLPLSQSSDRGAKRPGHRALVFADDLDTENTRIDPQIPLPTASDRMRAPPEGANAPDSDSRVTGARGSRGSER